MNPTRTLLSWLLLALPALPARATMDNGPCLALYRENRFAESAECLNQRVYESEGRDTALLAGLYEGLGVNYMMLEKKALAASAFARLTALRPNYEMDPNAYLPEIISLYQSVKIENRNRLAALNPAPVPLYLTACRVLPFGAPQFVNHEKKKGVVLLALQAAALGVSIACYAKRNSLDTGEFGIAEEDFDSARAYDRAYKISFFTFAAAYLASLIDGRKTAGPGARP